ncbi:MAG TPA: hypothetical protein VKF32_12190 [Thermoanaerobaculia bacterium]|nr:hypothetical protein [Thermoanaerobaculia bacterium]
MRPTRFFPLFLAVALAVPAACAQELPAPEPAEAPAPRQRLRIDVEVRLGFRDSKDLSSPIFTPFPGVTRPGPLTQRTVDPGSSFELDTVNLRAEGELARGVFAKAEVHFLDLYNRNPTSSGDKVAVREAWVRFGDPDALYALVGQAPRFSKQTTRHLESYGMWGTAVGRFEQPQVQAGAALGPHIYLKAMLGNGNPLFLRDTNALAGDNGTPERVPGSPRRVFETGMPIFYDTKPSDVSFAERLEWGAGAGARFGRDDGPSLDVLAWWFSRRLADSAHISGSELPGELELLKGEGFPLPFHGRNRREWGVNVVGRLAGFRLFAQYVDQDLAGLGRNGYEVELAWIQPLGGVFALGDMPFLTWVQPVVRVSRIHNLFEGTFRFPSLSALWEYWTKYDLGVRIGLVRGVDLTIEFSRHDAVTPVSTLHPDELLAVLRFRF